MPGEVELIMFGIQAALRINAQFRRGFADATRSDAITLPLPNFNPVPDAATALFFYTNPDGQPFRQSNARVNVLVTKLETTAGLTDAETTELLTLCREHQALVRARAGILVGPGVENPASLANEDVWHLLTIRQWRKGEDPHPTMLRRMAGTLITLAVDYCATRPDLISPASPHGKALRGFLEAIQGIDFAGGPAERIIEQLFLATIETLQEHPDLVAQDEKARLLVHNVARGLYDDARRRVDAATGDLSRQEKIQDWAQFVFRSVLHSASQTVFAQPDQFFGIRDGDRQELVGRVGQAVLGVVLDSQGVQVEHLFTADGMDRIMRAALQVVGQHPELVAGGNQALQSLIGTSLQALSTSSNPIGKDFLPEALRIILQKTGDHLDLLMPAGLDQPARHLLVVAAEETLRLLAAPPAGSVTRPLQFGTQHAQQVLERVIDEVVQNPRWLEPLSAGGASVLGEVTHAVLDILRNTAGPRLRPETAVRILSAAYRAVGQRLQFLTRDPQNRPLLALALETVFTAVFRPDADVNAQWLLLCDATLGRMAEIVLEALARSGVTLEKIEKVNLEIGKAMQILAAGSRWSLEDFALSLEGALT